MVYTLTKPDANTLGQWLNKLWTQTNAQWRLGGGAKAGSIWSWPANRN